MVTPSAPGTVPSTEVLLQGVLEAYKSEFTEIQDSWRLLETKAQAVATVGGVFVAAGFAFARELPLAASPVVRVTLSASIVLLLLAIGFGVSALFVREVPLPLGGAGTAKLVEDLIPLLAQAEGFERYCNMLRDTIRTWEHATTAFRKVNSDKAQRIAVGQVFLLVAAGLVSALVVGKALGG